MQASLHKLVTVPQGLSMFSASCPKLQSSSICLLKITNTICMVTFTVLWEPAKYVLQHKVGPCLPIHSISVIATVPLLRRSKMSGPLAFKHYVL